MTIHRQPTPQSSHIAVLEYDEDAHTLTITYKSGRAYVYDQVPYDVYQSVADADSVGSAVHSQIKGTYNARPL